MEIVAYVPSDGNVSVGDIVNIGASVKGGFGSVVGRAAATDRVWHIRTNYGAFLFFTILHIHTI